MDSTYQDMFCLDCGYALTNLDERKCPQCGRPYDPSDSTTVDTKPIEESRPQWLRTLLFGEREGGRCHYCGYSLKGLGKQGNCPECGTEYTEESASRLKPRPGALVVCLRLGWPLFIVIVLFFFLLILGNDSVYLVVIIFNLVVSILMLFVVAPINGYFQVRSMLRMHLPEQKRTQGFIAGLRAIGTVVVWFWVVVFSLLVVWGLILVF